MSYFNENIRINTFARFYIFDQSLIFISSHIHGSLSQTYKQYCFFKSTPSYPYLCPSFLLRPPSSYSPPFPSSDQSPTNAPDDHHSHITTMHSQKRYHMHHQILIPIAQTGQQQWINARRLRYECQEHRHSSLGIVQSMQLCTIEIRCSAQ